MNISKTTFISLTPSSHMTCFANENTANLYLHNQDESIIIEFIPEHLPTLKTLVAALQQLEAKLQQLKLDNLQRQLNSLKQCSENNNGKLSTAADSDF